MLLFHFWDPMEAAAETHVTPSGEVCYNTD